MSSPSLLLVSIAKKNQSAQLYNTASKKMSEERKILNCISSLSILLYFNIDLYYVSSKAIAHFYCP